MAAVLVSPGLCQSFGKELGTQQSLNQRPANRSLTLNTATNYKPQVTGVVTRQYNAFIKTTASVKHGFDK